MSGHGLRRALSRVAGPGLPCGPRTGRTLRTRTNGRGRVACATAASTCCAQDVDDMADLAVVNRRFEDIR
jgi:hypothetical protein